MKRNKFWLFAVLTVLAALLVACGNDDEVTSTEKDTIEEVLINEVPEVIGVEQVL